MSSYFSGRVHSIVFQNDAQNFFIMRMMMDEDGKLVTVRGNVPGIGVKIGTWFGFDGTWEKHSQYGMQLRIDKAPVMRGGWTPETAMRVLSSQGVSESILGRIHLLYGSEMIEALGDAEKLQDVSGITEFTALHIVSRWKASKVMFQTLDFLSAFDLPKVKVDQIWATFGDEAEVILSDNPWALVQIDGITFEQADEVARKLNLDLGSPLRVRGAVLYVSKSQRGMGHLYLSPEDMTAGVKRLVPGVSNQAIAQALKESHDEKLLVLDRKTKPGTVAIYEPWYHRIECDAAVRLRQRYQTAALEGEALKEYMTLLATVGVHTEEAVKEGKPLEVVAGIALDEWAETSKVQLSEQQRKGAVNALTCPVSVLTGLPGTGKTTTLRVVVKVLQDAGIPFLLVAPTGIAAKRLQSVTGAEASTIHRAFGAKGATEEEREATYAGVVGDSTDQVGADGSTEFWSFSEAKPHPAKVVIIDESSMVDQHLLFRLLSCTADNTRLVFVGDAAQLPSVGPGNVLRDLIGSGMFPTTSLHEIFRQKDTSDIVIAAHAIHAGKVPEFSTPSKDFTFVEIQDEGRIRDTILATVKTLYDRRINFQVLSPRHSGELGVTNLNLHIRELLNPKSPGLKEMRLGPETIREGDRVMVAKNNYRYEIFNGDVGKVVNLNPKLKEVTIKIHGPPVVQVNLPFKEAPAHLRMAYCITCHKCLHGDTWVETGEGLQRIRDIPESGLIGTREGPREFCNRVHNPPSKMLEIRTRDGYQITVTPEHGIDVWDSHSGEYLRKEAKEVTLGDFLRLKLGVGVEPKATPSLPPPPTKDIRAKAHRIPTQMSLELAEFLGLMVGDGTLYSRGFRLAKRHVEVADRFEEISRILFEATPKRFFTNNAHHVEVCSTQLASWLQQFEGLLPNKKHVPACILQSPTPFQKRFLRGLFEDGSVHVRTPHPDLLDHVEWSNRDPDVVQLVRTMLLRIGVVCGGLSGDGGKALQIYGANATLFGQEVGFISPEKQRRVSLPCGKETRYVIPISPERVKRIRKALGQGFSTSAYQNGVNRSRISRHQAKLVAPFEGVDSEWVRDQLSYHHSPVTSISEVEGESYCVEVPEGHHFLQNGFCGWNSQGQEYDVIVIPWVNSFRRQLQRNLIYTAITRARKKVIVVGHTSALKTAIENANADARNTLFPERIQAAFKGD